MKKAYYFSHDHGARNDPKLLKVRSKYGLWGVGLYWCLVEIMYEQGGSVSLDEIDGIAYDLRVTVEELGGFLDANPDLFTIEDETVTSDSIIRRLDQLKATSDKYRNNARKRWDKKEPQQSNGNAVALDGFDSFWDKYHDKTQRRKEDKVPAMKKWKRLTKAERGRAVDNIEAYVDSLSDLKYAQKARTYLDSKSFDNEFEKQQSLEF